ncbi:uncharacterized protein LOC134208353 isoform X2 [Armigeres subalbatus]|uniref:uncharacterized protein LOC134208353 isoform X2 n=1 Tax=Armigeres subalbatus TaxID=124917 RepID=UPI002ED32209
MKKKYVVSKLRLPGFNVSLLAENSHEHERVGKNASFVKRSSLQEVGHRRFTFVVPSGVLQESYTHLLTLEILSQEILRRRCNRPFVNSTECSEISLDQPPLWSPKRQR